MKKHVLLLTIFLLPLLASAIPSYTFNDMTMSVVLPDVIQKNDLRNISIYAYDNNGTELTNSTGMCEYSVLSQEGYQYTKTNANYDNGFYVTLNETNRTEDITLNVNCYSGSSNALFKDTSKVRFVNRVDREHLFYSNPYENTTLKIIALFIVLVLTVLTYLVRFDEVFTFMSFVIVGISLITSLYFESFIAGFSYFIVICFMVSYFNFKKIDG